MTDTFISLLFRVVELLVLIGFIYGVLRTKLQIIDRDIKRAGESLIALVKESVNMKVLAGKQEVMNNDIKERLETVIDRLDVYQMAIRDLEITTASNTEAISDLKRRKV